MEESTFCQKWARGHAPRVAKQNHIGAFSNLCTRPLMYRFDSSYLCAGITIGRIYRLIVDWLCRFGEGPLSRPSDSW
jgi:hypothetical protein